MAGIVVVVSAGNSGSQCGTVSSPPAIFEGSFSVGAIAINDTIIGFSSRGPVTVDSTFRLKPNVAAPGGGIRSARPGGQYGNSSGTSMAGPHVAGTVALIISANPALAGEVELIEDIIEQTAVPKTTDQQCGDVQGSEVPNNTYGYGRLDALAAVEQALTITHVGDVNTVSGLVRLFPNPAHDMVTIQLSTAAPNLQYQMLNIQGKVVHQGQLDATDGQLYHIGIPDVLPGCYIISLTNDDLHISHKLIVE
jgi:subtilisin family serine protease